MNKAETTIDGVKASIRRNNFGSMRGEKTFTLEAPSNAWLVEVYVKTTDDLHKYFCEGEAITGTFDLWSRTHCHRAKDQHRYKEAILAEKERYRAKRAPEVFLDSLSGLTIVPLLQSIGGPWILDLGT